MVMVILEHQVNFYHQTGTDLAWIDANTTSVANANNVGTNLNSTNADQFVLHLLKTVGGNNPIKELIGIKYNPSTNRFTN